MNLSRWITHRARFTPDRIAIRFEGAELSYAALERRIARRAAILRSALVVNEGDSVAYLGQNSPDVLELMFACARLGAIFVPLNWRLAPPEHRTILKHCAPKALFVEPPFREAAEATAAVQGGVLLRGSSDGRWLGDDELGEAESGADHADRGRLESPLLLVYTSGTTGSPKGVLLTQQALFWNALNAIAAHDMTSADRVLTVLPMFHVGGLNIQTTPALHAGASVTIHRRFDAAAALASIAAERTTLFLAVPQVSLAMSSHPAWPRTDLSSLRLVATGSSTVPEAVIRPWHDRGIPVTQVYGLTESAPVAICLRREDATRRVGSCGKPAAHCEARIVDDSGREVGADERGEIQLRGRNVFREYWQDPAATAGAFADGWLRTGDVGHRDADGYFFVDDRKKDVVISGGENVYPAEIESVLAASADIAEAAVVGRADARWGEIAVAFVVPKLGAALTSEAVLRLFAGRLARFKHPREVVFVESLPRNAMGKVRKDELRARLAALGDHSPRA